MNSVFSFMKGRQYGRQWIIDNIKLPHAETATAGRYNPSYNPAVLAIFDFVATTKARELHLVKSSQCGATLHSLTLLCHLREHGGNAIVVSDSKKNSIDIGRRYEAIQNATSPNASKYRKRNDKGQETKIFSNGTVWFLGSGNAGQLASRQAKILIADEVDKHRDQSKEAATTGLLRQRMKTHKDGLMLCFSTPTNTDGQIWTNYQACDFKAGVYLACPGCTRHVDSYTLLDIERLQIRCKCGHVWTEKERKLACQTPLIRCHDVQPATLEGLSLGVTYSDIANPNIDIAGMLRKLKSTDNITTRREILQNTFAIPYDAEVDKAIESVRLIAAQDKPEHGELGFKFLGVDVQANSFKFVQVQLYNDENASHILKVLKCGEVARLNELDELINESKLTVIDDGGRRTWEVRPLVAGYRGKVLLTKGSGKHVKVYRETVVDVVKGNKAHQLPMLWFVDEIMKDYTYFLLKEGRLNISPLVGNKEFMDEISSERKQEVINNRGQRSYQYFARGKNDYGDALKLCCLVQLMFEERKAELKQRTKNN